jgi:hypothetical protein
VARAEVNLATESASVSGVAEAGGGLELAALQAAVQRVGAQ